jgi:hypothetical protein
MFQPNRRLNKAPYPLQGIATLLVCRWPGLRIRADMPKKYQDFAYTFKNLQEKIGFLLITAQSYDE